MRIYFTKIGLVGFYYSLDTLGTQKNTSIFCKSKYWYCSFQVCIDLLQHKLASIIDISIALRIIRYEVHTNLSIGKNIILVIGSIMLSYKNIY